MASFYKNVIVMSPSAEVNDDYEEYEEDPRFTFIYDPDGTHLTELFERSRECKKKVKRRRQKRKKLQALGRTPQEVDEMYPPVIMPRNLVIVDDCLDSGILAFTGPLERYAARGRHVDLGIMVTTQRLRGVTPTLRNNSDFVFVFCPYNTMECEKFFEEYVTHDKRKEMRLMLNEIFKHKYVFILVNNYVRDYNQRLFISDAENFIKGIVTPLVFTETDEDKIHSWKTTHTMT